MFNGSFSNIYIFIDTDAVIGKIAVYWSPILPTVWVRVRVRES